jgi:hypothetical protein
MFNIHKLFPCFLTKKQKNLLTIWGLFGILMWRSERAQYAKKSEIAREIEVTSMEYVRWRETAGESGG